MNKEKTIIFSLLDFKIKMSQKLICTYLLILRLLSSLLLRVHLSSKISKIQEKNQIPKSFKVFGPFYKVKHT